MENQFRIGGVYRRRGDHQVVELKAESNGDIDRWNDKRPGHTFVLAQSLGGMPRGYVSLVNGRYCDGFSREAHEWDLIPGELHNVGGEWVPISAPNDEGWIEWKGGECPVSPETLVEVESDKSWAFTSTQPAGGLIWEHVFPSGGGNITAYRVAEQKEGSLGDKLKSVLARNEPKPRDFGAIGETASAVVVENYEGKHGRIGRRALDPNAAMIARDGEAKPKAIQPAPEPVSNVKPAIQGLTIERPLTGLVLPGFGSALLG